VDIVRFATELKNLHEKIDRKLCKNGLANSESTGGQCGQEENKRGLRGALKGQGEGKWPNISSTRNGVGHGTVDATGTISSEMAGFNTEEKGITAGLFARTVE
ncbi:MAG: hypothetical protein AB8U44_04290, partial [Aaplasma endosymbiont of Hyalomma asiaticum]